MPENLPAEGSVARMEFLLSLRRRGIGSADVLRAMDEVPREHFVTAAGFGARMVGGGLACIVNAVIPALFVRTASDTVKSLYGRMKARQPAFAEKPPAFTEPGWQLEYEI